MSRRFTWEQVYGYIEKLQEPMPDDIIADLQLLFVEPEEDIERESRCCVSESKFHYGLPPKEEEEHAFTIDELVEYAVDNLSAEAGMALQNVLFGLLAEDGTKVERKKVASISRRIIEREKECGKYLLDKHEANKAYLMEDEKKKHITVQNNFYAPIGQYIEHVEHNHFGMAGDGNFQFGDAKGDEVQKNLFPELPTQQEMCAAVRESYRQGYWWSNRSWAVVYRVYQLKGYMKGISGFVREVEAWNAGVEFVCNYDAVQKPVAEGTLIGPVEKWEENGAHKQNVKLAFALLEILDKK